MGSRIWDEYNEIMIYQERNQEAKERLDQKAEELLGPKMTCSPFQDIQDQPIFEGDFIQVFKDKERTNSYYVRVEKREGEFHAGREALLEDVYGDCLVVGNMYEYKKNFI